MAEQEKLGLNVEQKINSVEELKFEPIKGYPMLNWKGKRPFTSTQFYPAQLKENHGEEINGWMNKIFWGDNLQVMSHLLKHYRGQIDLIYIDPPFDSKADYKKKIQLKSKTIESDKTAFEEKQYTDIWTNDEFLQFMYERLIILRELLSTNGTIYLHCDFHKNYLIRAILDELFGPTNFLNEIIWYYPNKFKFQFAKSFGADTETILAYAKSKGNHTLNHIKVPVKNKIKQNKVTWDAEQKKMVTVKDENGKVVYYDAEDKIVGTLWEIARVNSMAKEVTGYPTQKPEELLERIITAGSNPGDLIFDCFMGSGTTQAVAMKLGRKFIGADINLGAIQTTTKRLINVANELKTQLQEEPKYTGFQVYNVNYYDVFRNPLEAKDLLIKALEIQPLPNNVLYDGEKDGRMVKIMPVNRIATRADLNELITNFDYKEFEKANDANPGKAVEHLLLVCMGHEADLAAQLQSAVPYKLDIEVVDILRDKSNLEFKRDSEAEVVIEGGKLLIREFYPMNLLQKLSIQKENVENWKELADSVMIDFNYDGAVLEPQIVDVPEKD
ncbi:MAG: hypothetical protein POELPBGB_03174 [Bacteroidia bacterium]|nr:hypothetical protein [Bacteroidia bacterium]